MIYIQELENLISSLDQAVEDGLAYFSKLETESDVRVGEWGPREVLSNMIIWHQSSIDGMESIFTDNPPPHMTGKTDELNARAVEATAGQSLGQIIEHMRALQARLLTAVRALPDPTVAILINCATERSSHVGSNALQRLKILADHWNEHVAEFEAVAED